MRSFAIAAVNSIWSNVLSPKGRRQSPLGDHVEKGKPGAELDSVFRTLRVLGILLDTTTASTSPEKLAQPDIDLGALIEAARKPRR